MNLNSYSDKPKVESQIATITSFAAGVTIAYAGIEIYQRIKKNSGSTSDFFFLSATILTAGLAWRYANIAHRSTLAKNPKDKKS